MTTYQELEHHLQSLGLKEAVRYCYAHLPEVLHITKHWSHCVLMRDMKYYKLYMEFNAQHPEGNVVLAYRTQKDFLPVVFGRKFVVNNHCLSDDRYLDRMLEHNELEFFDGIVDYLRKA